MRLALALALGACGGKHATTKLSIHLTDATTKAPIAGRVLLWKGDQPLHLGTIDLYGQRQGATACSFAPGAVGTWDGIVMANSADVPVGDGACMIPHGHYEVTAWHGIDHELWTGEVDLTTDATLEIALVPAWTTTWLAADMHVHAAASNDSGMPDTQRVVAQLAAGIDVIGLSNHNTVGDASTAIHTLGLDGRIHSIASDEITSEMMHAGIYPAHSAPPADQIIRADPKTLLAMLRALPDHPVIQINHPRFRYQSLFDTTKWDGVAWPPPFPPDFDAVEVVPGYAAFNVAGDRRLDDGLRDFYTLYDHGHPVAAMGGSDTHDFNWVLDGTARTYVHSAPYDQGTFVDAIRARRTMATSGPWLDATIGDAGPGQFATGHNVHLVITTAQAKWMHATRLRVQVGDKTTTLPVQAKTELDLDIAEDTFVGVAIDGDDPEPLELTGTYQRDKWKHPGVTPFAVISPILVDADGDHHWKRGDADLTY